jgi:hypothetical protein
MNEEAAGLLSKADRSIAAARIACDYGVEMVLRPADVEEMIQRAQNFLDAARHYLRSETTRG